MNTCKQAAIFIAVHLCLIFPQAYGAEAEKASVPSDTTQEQAIWQLERLNIDRIKSYAAKYQQQLKRSDICQKVLLFSGGVVAAGALAWLCSKFFCKKKEQALNESPVYIPPGREITEAEWRRALLALKREQIDDNKAYAFWEGIKHSANDGAAWAVGSFIATIGLAALTVAWKIAGKGIIRTIGLFSSKEYVQEHEQLVNMVGKSLGDIIPEYEQACEHVLTFGAKDTMATSFVTFLEREIVKQHASFIQSIEETIAFLSELQQHNVKFTNKELLQVFDDQIKIFWNVLDSYADVLEQMLNAPLDSNKPSRCKKVTLISKQVYYQISRFVEECKSLAMEA